jgi:hypothetical protein
MLSFAYKRFDGKVPEPGELDDEDLFTGRRGDHARGRHSRPQHLAQV